LNTSSIFIIGKGPSIDELTDINLLDGLIININDSEKIIQGNIGVFSANWVRHSLKDRGFKCQYYFTGKPLPAAVPHTVLPPIPIELDSDELMLFRFELSTFFDESFVLLNALKICKQIAEEQAKAHDVYLLGFDFSTEKGEVSKTLGRDFATEQPVDRALVVHSQEFAYLQLVNYFRDQPLIRLHHVGSKPYSTFTVDRFKEKFSGKKVRHRTVNTVEPDHHKVTIVAELTNNHLGDVNRLKEMVERSVEAGADLIKVQKRDVDSFYSEDKLNSYYWSPFGKTLGDYRRGVELDEEKLSVLDETCKVFGISWFCSVLDYPSFELIQKFNPSLIKIPSTISNHTDFHKKVAAEYHGAIVVSTGYTDSNYESYIIDTFKENERIFLLHCISAYPTVLQDCNLAVIRHYVELAKKYPIIPGYSSHDLGSFASTLAVACGAKMIEKHVKLGDVSWVHFDKVAVDLEDGSFKKFVQDIRQAEAALGSSIKRILPSEHHKYEVVKK